MNILKQALVLVKFRSGTLVFLALALATLFKTLPAQASPERQALKRAQASVAKVQSEKYLSRLQQYNLEKWNFAHGTGPAPNAVKLETDLSDITVERAKKLGQIKRDFSLKNSAKTHQLLTQLFNKSNQTSGQSKAASSTSKATSAPQNSGPAIDSSGLKDELKYQSKKRRRTE